MDTTLEQTMIDWGIIRHFAHEDWSDDDIISIFGEIPSNLIRFNDSWKMAHLVHSANLFDSIGDARKNGWDRPIAPGFQNCWSTKQMKIGNNLYGDTGARVGKGKDTKIIFVLGKPIA